MNNLKRMKEWVERKSTGDPAAVLLFPLVIVLAGLWAVVYEVGDRSMTAHLNPSAMSIQKEPHGCDFNDAPMGDKHCHFKKVVASPPTEGTIYGTDNATGYRVFSRDGGKTWNWVYLNVTWEKVED